MLRETFPTVDGTSLSRLERDLCILAAVVAGDLVHLPGTPIVSITHNFPPFQPVIPKKMNDISPRIPEKKP
jgi:hypothetical protein